MTVADSTFWHFHQAFRDGTGGPGSFRVMKGTDATGEPIDTLPSAYPVTDFAGAAIGATALAAHRLATTLDIAPPHQPVVVDRRLASIWFGGTIQPMGWELPSLWDAIAGNYLAGDRFVRLHTNAPAHRAAALTVLGCDADRDAVAAAVATWDPFELHDAVVDAGGVAAALRTRDEWLDHPQGAALQSEPIVHHEMFPGTKAPVGGFEGRDGRPLDGVKVLDLTRVLAGPVATRFLAGLGADVLRIDPPEWNEPGTVPEVNLGKRCARLNLRDDADRATFEALLQSADILVHGYRTGALDGLGYDAERRRELNPSLVDVSLNAWGHSGPWADRRGFDSIVQVACGIAAAGMDAYGTEIPKPLPVQALDHAAGYTLARCALGGWTDRIRTGAGSRWRTSLAAHAELLCSVADDERPDLHANFPAMATSDLQLAVEKTTWGPARRAHAPVHIPGVHLHWTTGASDHATSDPSWKSDAD